MIPMLGPKAEQYWLLGALRLECEGKAMNTRAVAKSPQIAINILFLLTQGLSKPI